MNESKSAARSVSVKAKAKSGGGRKIRHITIEPSDNGGHMMSVHHESDDTEDKMQSMGYMKPEKSVHETTDSMMEHLGKVVGHKPNKASTKQAAGGKKEAMAAAKVDAAEKV